MGKKLSSKNKDWRFFPAPPAPKPPKPPVTFVKLEEQFFKELRQMTIDLFVSMGTPPVIQPDGKLKIRTRKSVANIMDIMHTYAGF